MRDASGSAARSTPCSSTTPSTTCSPRTTCGRRSRRRSCTAGRAASPCSCPTTPPRRSRRAPTTAATTAPTAAAVRYLDWTWDPDPTDTWTSTEYAFLLRDADGSRRVVHETHRLGLFGRDVWLRLLAGAGFEPRRCPEETTEDAPPRELFVGRRA